MEVAARLVPAALRRPGRQRDATVAGMTAGMALGFLWADVTLFGPGLPWWLLAGIQLAGAASLLAWRRAPLTVALVNACLSVPAAALAAAPAGYAAIAYGAHPRRIWAVVAALVVVTARPWAPELTRSSRGEFTVELQPVLVFVLLAVFLGIRQRRRRARRAREARERERLAAAARADERARLVAEMHDVITHRVSLMVLQAGALQVSTADATVRRQADELRRSGRRALEELRELLSVIRTDPAGAPRHRAEPTVLDLADLVEASRGVGVPVDLVSDGPPPVASAVVVRTAYRVVQEALTNVRKHAPGSTVRISVQGDGDRLRLAVRNTPPAGPDGPPASAGPLAGTGTNGGLSGLRRRVELVNGSLSAAGQPDGGFEVRAVLPTGGGAG